MARTSISLEEYVLTRAWREMDQDSSEQVRDISNRFAVFYLSGYWSNRHQCWMLDGRPAYSQKRTAREYARLMAREFPESATRTWKITQKVPGELNQVAARAAEGCGQ